VKRIIKSSWLLEVITQISLNALQLIGIRKSVGYFSISPLLIQGAEKILSFATAVIVETAEIIAFDDSKMRNIYVFLLEGLKLSNNMNVYILEQSRLLLDWKCACCLIVSQLSRKTSFADSLKRVLANAISESFRSSVSFLDAQMEKKLLSILFQTCYILAEKGILDFTKKLVKEFLVLGEKQYNSEDRSSNVLIHYLLTPSENLDEDESPERATVRNYSFTFQFLNRLTELMTEPDLENALTNDETVGTAVIDKDFDYELLANVFAKLFREEEFFTYKDSITFIMKQLVSCLALQQKNYSEQRISQIKMIIKLFAQRNPTHFDELITNIYTSLPEDQQNDKEKITLLLNEIFHASSSSSASSAEAAASVAHSSHDLFLSLHSPIKQFRLEAIKKCISLADFYLENLEKTENTMELIKLLFSFLQTEMDYDLLVVLLNEKLFQLFLGFLPVHEVMECLKNTFQWWFANINLENNSCELNYSVLVQLLTVLKNGSIYTKLFEAENDDQHQHIDLQERRIWLSSWTISVLLSETSLFLSSSSSKSLEKLVLKLKKRSFELFHRLHPSLLIEEKEKEGKSSTKKNSKDKNKGTEEPAHKHYDSVSTRGEILQNVKELLGSKKPTNKKNVGNDELTGFLNQCLLSSTLSSIPFINLSMLSFLNAFCSELSAVLSGEIRNSILSKMSRLVLSLTDRTTEDSNFVETKRILPEIQNYFEIYSKTFVKAKPQTLSKLLSENVQDDSNESFKMQLFIHLCLSDNLQFYECIDSFLLQLFPSEYSYLLFLVDVLQLNYERFSLSVEELSAIQLMAYQILLLSFENESKKNSSSGSPHSEFCIFLVPLILWGSSHSLRKIREISLHGCEIMMELDGEKGEFSLHHDHATLKLHFAVLKQLAAVLLQKASMIKTQSEASFPLLMDSFNNSKEFSDLQGQIWDLIVFFYQKNNSFCTEILLSLMKLLSNQHENLLHYLFQAFEFFISEKRVDSANSVVIHTSVNILGDSFASFPIKEQSRLIEFIQDVLSKENKLSSSNNLLEMKRQFLLFLANPSFKRSMKNALKIKTLSQILFQQYLLQTSVATSSARDLNQLVTNALTALPLEHEIFYLELTKEVDIFTKNMNTDVSKGKKPRAKSEETDSEMEVVDSSHPMNHLLNESIQRILLILEAHIRCFNSEVISFNSEMIHLLFQLMKKFNENSFLFLNYSNDEEGSSVLSLEYIFTVLAEAVSLNLSTLFNHKLISVSEETAATTTTPAKGKKGASKTAKTPGNESSSAAVTSGSVYETNNFFVDAEILLQSLSFVKVFSYQIFVCKIVKIFLSLSPKLGKTVFSKLVGLLLNVTAGSSPLTSSKTQGSLPLLEKVLFQLFEIRSIYLQGSQKESSSNDNTSELQFSSMNTLCFDLLSTFGDLTQQERQLHLRSVMKVLHEITLTRTEQDINHADNTDYGMSEYDVFFQCMFNGLICQTVASYENADSNQNNAQKNAKQLQQQQNEIDTICLSRASQKRANRAMTTSSPEQYYQLCHYLFHHMPAHLQIKLLINLIFDGEKYYSFAVKMSADDENKDHLLTLDSLNYLNSLIETRENSKENLLFKGYSATISMIYMEFLLEILENKKFHRNLVRSINKNNEQNTKSVVLQHDLLELTDNFLQFIISVEKSRSQFLSQSGQTKTGDDRLLLRIEHETYPIAKGSLADIIFNSSLSCIQAFQILLDVPSFISIIQELLNHDLLNIRQRAIIILKDRLQELNFEKVAEVELFYELFVRMKSIVVDYFNWNKEQQQSSKKGKNAKNQKPDSLAVQQHHQQIPLIQSAIMCLDILLQFMGKTVSWKGEILSLLQLFVDSIPLLYEECAQEKTLELSLPLIDRKKLLGSLFLCLATNFRTLGANILNFLPSVMKSLLMIYQSEIELWNSLQSTQQQQVGKVLWNKTIPEFKSQVLFIRTLIMSLNIIVSSMSNFVHTYVKPIFIQFFKSFSFQLNVSIHKEFQLIYDDISIFLSLIIKEVPVRLLIPLLNEIIVEIQTMKNIFAIQQFMDDFLLPLIMKLDRKDVINSFSSWITVSTSLLDFRWKLSVDKYMNSVEQEDRKEIMEEIDSIEVSVTQIIKEIALKLTEKELKSFILKLLEWKNNSTTEHTEVTVILKGISFYSGLNELIKTLKQLFNSTMNLLWEEYLENCEENKEKVQSLIDVGTSAASSKENSGSQKKRRKLTEIKNYLKKQDLMKLEFLESYNIILLTIIQSLSDHGHGTFINEVNIVFCS
jgi:hypothetical protein